MRRSVRLHRPSQSQSHLQDDTEFTVQRHTPTQRIRLCTPIERSISSESRASTGSMDEWLVPKNIATRRVRFSAGGCLGHRDGRQAAVRVRQATPSPAGVGTSEPEASDEAPDLSLAEISARSAVMHLSESSQVQLSSPASATVHTSTTVSQHGMATAPLSRALGPLQPRPSPPMAAKHAGTVQVVTLDIRDVQPHVANRVTGIRDGPISSTPDLPSRHWVGDAKGRTLLPRPNPMTRQRPAGSGKIETRQRNSVRHRGSHRMQRHRGSLSHAQLRHHPHVHAHSHSPHTIRVYFAADNGGSTLVSPPGPPGPTPVTVSTSAGGPWPFLGLPTSPQNMDGSWPLVPVQTQTAFASQPTSDHGISAITQTTPQPAIYGALTSSPTGTYLQQGTLFGGVATLSTEVLQLALAKRRGEQVSIETHGPQVVSSVVRGSLFGAAGAGLSLLGGPAASAVLFLILGLSQECAKISRGLIQSELKSREAALRVAESFFGAAGGFSAAWSSTAILVGCGGAVSAAMAGCCALAGNMAGQHLGALMVGLLPDSEEECTLTAAYTELGLTPNCTDRELRCAFIHAARSLHPDRLGPRRPGAHERFCRINAAMECIRSERLGSSTGSGRSGRALIPQNLEILAPRKSNLRVRELEPQSQAVCDVPF
mmetsp:Transcript_90002/g.178915  ORF Transcript_90002/g.178915 Transcript_90002/m.178915 type:complete len:655 (-) Transcript_90002:79-2043(-)